MKTSSAVKTKTEIELIRKACGISAKLHLLAMTSNYEGLSESDLAKKIKKSYQVSEASGWAYPILIGAGDRSTIIHAKPTQRKIQNDDLILMDAGVKYKGYCSDITRTWPASVRFTKEQKQIYKIVLKAQREVINRVKVKENLNSLHQMSKDYLAEGLLSAGIIKTDDISQVFPHKTSHWIGKHVHDNCQYYYQDKTAVELSAGMVFTVEPGLYFKDHGKYSNIGVRIEDIVVVTENGCEVLSHVPKEVEEIEELRSWAVA